MKVNAAATAAKIITADTDRRIRVSDMIPVRIEDISAGCVTVPDDVTVIGDGAFAGNRSLIHADLRNVTHIGARAFQECSNLESVEMNNVSVIGPGAFEFCRSLRRVSFRNVTEIGDEAFLYCSMLDIPEMPRTLASAGTAAFSHTAVRRIDLHRMETIPPFMCSGCTALSHADISGAREIGDDAFSECRSLSRVRMSAAEKIGNRAFRKCSSFAPGSLPDSLQSVGDDAFGCVRDGLIVPESVREFGKNCFGPVDTKKSIRIYGSSLYRFRDYFCDERGSTDTETERFHMWESSLDVTILDHEGKMNGFLPLYVDLEPEMLRALKNAFRDDNTFDYSVLDTVLFGGMSWNLRAKDRLAVMRLRYPFELNASAREGYVRYISGHLERIAHNAVRDRDIGMLSILCDEGLICSENILDVIDHAVSMSASECTAFLLKRRSEMGGRRDMAPEEL